MARSDPPPTTSASQLVAWSMCPRKYFFTYISDATPEFRSTSLVIGSTVHSAIEWYFEERLAGRTPTPAAAEDIFTMDFIAATTEVPVRFKDTTPDELEAEGRRLVTTYLAAHGSLPVVAVEQPFEVELVDPATGAEFGRPLKGYFDLVLEDRVVELKTSARGWSPHDLDRHLQLGAYCFASSTIFAALPVVETHVVVKLKREPRVERFVLERSAGELRWWMRAAKEIEAAIATMNFPPTPGPLCRDCEYSKACMALVDDVPLVAEQRPRRLPAASPSVSLAL